MEEFSSNKQLLDFLVKSGYLKTPSIIEAFKEIERKEFVPDDLAKEAYYNIPLPIGFAQTISQPVVVAFILELLKPKPGEKILDVGSGSGWTASLLAHTLGSEGKVFAVERIPELCELGKKNISKFGFLKEGRVEIFCRNGFAGLPEIAEKIGGFDGIISGASAEEIPAAWKKQIKIGGRIVSPVKNSILYSEKKDENSFLEKEFFGFSFVPLVRQ